MRLIRYLVASSLDGYIVGPNGEVDWIVPDPDFDFGALFKQFDTVLLGRRTYELTQSPGAPPWPPGISVYVFSRTLRPGDHPGVTVVADDLEQTVAALRARPGKDIWLFGGASLCASLLDVRLLDTVEVAVMPVLLGGGMPLVAALARRAKLTLTDHEASRVGAVRLRYAVQERKEG